MQGVLQELKSIWNQQKVWIIVLFVQIVFNLLGPLLPEGFQVALMYSSGAVLLAFSGYSIYKQRENMLGLLMNIMMSYFNYSLVMGVYWNTGGLEKIFDGYRWKEFLSSMNIELLFYGLYTMILSGNQVKNRRIFLKKVKPSFPVVSACALYIALAPFLFYRTSAFGVRGSATALYEYSLVILIVALYFSGRDLRALTALGVASAWIIFHGMLHGERILALQMLIAWGIYLTLHFLSIKLVIPCCILGVLAFALFGIYRGVVALQNGSVWDAFARIIRKGFVSDTAYYAYWAGMSIERLKAATPIIERFGYFARYVLYLFAGSSIPDVNLPIIAAKLNLNLGGGWLPFYVNFWLGPIGVAFAGIGIARLVNGLSEFPKGHNFKNYLVLYVIATVPRWYLYSPSSITRGILIFSVFFVACCVGKKVCDKVLHAAKEKWVKGQPEEQ